MLMFRELLVTEFVSTGKEATTWKIKKVGKTLTTFWYYHAFLIWQRIHDSLRQPAIWTSKWPIIIRTTRVLQGTTAFVLYKSNSKMVFHIWLLFIYVLWSNFINNGHINFHQWLARWFKPTIYLKAFSFFLKGALYHRVSCEL